MLYLNSIILNNKWYEHLFRHSNARKRFCALPKQPTIVNAQWQRNSSPQRPLVAHGHYFRNCGQKAGFTAHRLATATCRLVGRNHSAFNSRCGRSA